MQLNTTGSKPGCYIHRGQQLEHLDKLQFKQIEKYRSQQLELNLSKQGNYMTTQHLSITTYSENKIENQSIKSEDNLPKNLYKSYNPIY